MIERHTYEPRLHLTGCWHDDLPLAVTDDELRDLAALVETDGFVPGEQTRRLCAAVLRRLVE